MRAAASDLDFTDRLCDELEESTGHAPERVRGAVEDAVASFDGARVQAYLPVLVHRAAVRALEVPGPDGSPAGPGAGTSQPNA